METKICTKCGIEKELNNFNICSKSKDGYNWNCKECRKDYRILNNEKDKKRKREYYIKNKEKIDNKNKENYHNNKEKFSEYGKKRYNQKKEEIKNMTSNYYYNNKDICSKRAKIYYENHKEKIKEKSKIYRIEHLEKIKKYSKEYSKKNKDKIYKIHKQRIDNDKIYYFKHRIRVLIRKSFVRKKENKNDHTEKILGCSVDYLINYLIETYEKKYNEKWDWGYLKEIHIDHIIPLSTANTKEEIIKLCHYKNLQLLKAEDNLSKGSKLEWEIGD